MGINRPIITEIAYRTYAINEFGMAACFLLLGKERGLLIDTGCGMYPIRELADSLTDLPYDVALSHAHGDHTGSAALWESVYVHPADFAGMRVDGKSKEMLRSYPEMMAKYGSFDAYDISADQIMLYDRVPTLLPMQDGHVFHLGGRDVEVMHMPGHTPGSVVFFDPFTRILFSGDACNVNLGAMAVSVTTTLRAMYRLQARASEFDRNYNGHIAYGGSTVYRCMPDSVLSDCVHILESILQHTAEVQVVPSRYKGGAARHSVKYGNTLISFDPDRLCDPGEEPLF